MGGLSDFSLELRYIPVIMRRSRNITTLTDSRTGDPTGEARIKTGGHRRNVTGNITANTGAPQCATIEDMSIVNSRGMTIVSR